MIILGLSHLEPSPFGHDSTVAILQDGILKAAVSEERFSRIKHDGSFPSMAIQYCLNELGITFSDVDKVVVGFGLESKFMDTDLKKKFSCVAKRDVRFHKTMMEEKNPIFYNHQYIHARTAYSFTNFNRAIVISLDGGGVDDGKQNSGGIFIVENGKIEPLMIYPSEASLGFTYGSLTDACGFRMQDGEGKTMSLAAFAENESSQEKDKAFEQISKIFPKFKGMEYQEGGIRGLVGKFYHNVQLLTNEDPSILILKKSIKKEIIAWATQKKLEEIVTELVLDAVEKTGIKNVVVSGGVFLNMIMNMKIRERLGKNYQICFNPICGDLGNAVGVVFEHYFQETGNVISHPNMSLYLGPSYSDEEIIVATKKLNLKYEKVDKIQEGIELIEREKVIGWFQDRAELGPRALGNRSILFLPTEKKFKDIVNSKIKKREQWRPFCPTIVSEKQSHFLCENLEAPYMILGCMMKNPLDYEAVSHIDGTCRPQILEKEVNPTYHDVVNGLNGIVLNTSFNLSGEPIVNTPTNALTSLKNSGLDAIIINDFLVTKNN